MWINKNKNIITLCDSEDKCIYAIFFNLKYPKNLYKGRKK